MPRFPEIVQFRAPAGAKEALDTLAKAEGRPSNDILRELLASRLATLQDAPTVVERAA